MKIPTNIVKIAGIAGATVCFVACLHYDVNGAIRSGLLLLIGGLAGYEIKNKVG